MYKYLHEILGLLHEFLSERQEPARPRRGARLAGDKTAGTDPERRDGPAPRRPAK